MDFSAGVHDVICIRRIMHFPSVMVAFSSMAEKRIVATITKGKCIINRMLKKKMYMNPCTGGTVKGVC